MLQNPEITRISVTPPTHTFSGKKGAQPAGKSLIQDNPSLLHVFYKHPAKALFPFSQSPRESACAHIFA